MQKLFAIVLIALFAVSCAGSKGCGCPSWGDIPSIDQSEQICVQVVNSPEDFVWN